MEKRLRLFLGNCVHASMGEWITLPMKEEELKSKVEEISKKYGELIISDYEKVDDKLYSLHISQYADVLQLNEILQKPIEYLALYIYSDEDINFTEEFYHNGRYLFLEGVENLEELGEAIVEKSLVSVPQHLLDLGYIDFEKIGNDFECNGIRLYKGLGAIGQISDRDYLKWSHLLEH